MDFDNLLEQVGGWGFYQKRLWLMLTVGLEAIVNQNVIFMMFAGAAPPWTCPTNGTVGNDSCELLDSCPQLQFQEDISTIVTEFRLYCSREFAGNVLTAMQMAGVLIGALFWGQMAELFGRKKILLLIYVSTLAASLATAFAPSWQLCAVLLFFMGLGCGGFLCVDFVAVQEIIASDRRLFAACLNGVNPAFMFLALISYLLPDWRSYLIVVNVIGIFGTTAFLWVDESPRWLMQHHRWAEAERVLGRIARTNGRPVPQLPLKPPAQPKRKKYTYHHLFRTRGQTQHFLALAFSWFTVCCVSYGLAFNVKNLPGNRYLSTFMLGILGAVVQGSMAFTNKWIGRRPTHLCSLILGGLSCFGVLICEALGESFDLEIKEKLMTGLAVFGGSILMPTWIIVYLYSAELFPTVIRNLSGGLCSVAARLGGTIAPLLLILRSTWAGLPFLIFTGLILLNVVWAFFALPETRGRPLPDVLPKKSSKQEKPLIPDSV